MVGSMPNVLKNPERVAVSILGQLANSKLKVLTTFEWSSGATIVGSIICINKSQKFITKCASYIFKQRYLPTAQHYCQMSNPHIYPSLGWCGSVCLTPHGNYMGQPKSPNWMDAVDTRTRASFLMGLGMQVRNLTFQKDQAKSKTKPGKRSNPRYASEQWSASESAFSLTAPSISPGSVDVQKVLKLHGIRLCTHKGAIIHSSDTLEKEDVLSSGIIKHNPFNFLLLDCLAISISEPYDQFIWATCWFPLSSLRDTYLKRFGACPHPLCSSFFLPLVISASVFLWLWRIVLCQRRARLSQRVATMDKNSNQSRPSNAQLDSMVSMRIQSPKCVALYTLSSGSLNRPIRLPCLAWSASCARVCSTLWMG